MLQKQPISRQIAINTLAAMHRRFSLPGPVQPHSRPIAEFRASANKSLDTLRQTIQSAVTRDIDQVIRKYLEVNTFFINALEIQSSLLSAASQSLVDFQTSTNKSLDTQYNLAATGD